MDFMRALQAALVISGFATLSSIKKNVTSFMKDLKYLVDALVREEINVDGVVAADRLTRQNSEADSLLAGVLVQEVQIR